MIEIALNNLLREQIAEIENRVYPNIMPQNCKKPALVYSLISSIESANMDGWCDSNSTKKLMQIDVFSASYAEKKQIAQSIITALKGFEYEVKNITHRDIFETDTSLYREIIEFKI